ncbi:hypothetical protein C8R45DRAFT_440054 [Mycena sanguinolenta]|nr:hypothetical protein C8R45DRAFT_440054 [Mycena sanguinolenta]
MTCAIEHPVPSGPAVSSSPFVHLLPAELVCEIFALALESVSGVDQPPWHLGHVCRSWRDAAIAYPQLWSSFTLPTAQLAMVKTQLRRSANAPLHVFWSANEDESNVVRVMDLVLAQCNRWVSLRLNLRFVSGALDWLSPVRGCLPLLERLEVLSGTDAVIPDVFLETPKLCQVILDEWSSHYFSPVISTWRQVTHYSGVYPTQSQLDILQAAPNLLTAHLDFQDPWEVDASVTLPHLRRLFIQSPWFLIHLTTPALEELYCVFRYRRTLLPFVHRSSCLLKKLVLMACPVDAELIGVLRGLPSLVYLLVESLNGAEVERQQRLLFRTMASRDDELCPNLTVFVYGIASDFPRDLFFAMAQSRFQSSLKRLRVFDPYDCPEFEVDSITTPLKLLRDEGFDARFLDEDDADLLMSKGFWSNSRLDNHY